MDKDGHEDILLAGNFHRAKPEVGMYDASYGLWLKGDGQLNFEPVNPKESGFEITGEVREIIDFQLGDDTVLLVAMNDEPMRVFKLNE